MKTTRLFRCWQRGFTLIEALTSMAVTAFGMLAVAGFYVTMSQNADVAKQRSEAVRLAQLKMEELRAFEQVAADGAGNRFDYTDDVVSGNDTVDANNGAYATNTSYARTWTVTGTGTDPQKWIRVEVTWTDRTNNGQNVVLRSVIARSDAAGIGTLAVGPGPTKPRSPKNRSVDIPYPAVSLAGGMSGFTPPGGGSPFYVFNNVTGEVLGSCTTALNEGATVTFGAGGCTAFATRAYLVTGYIRFVAGNFNLGDFVNPAGPARDLDAAIDLDVGQGTPACSSQRQKILSAGNIAAPRNISSASRSSGVVTLTTSGNHGFSAGQVISVNSATHVSFNGVFVLLTASGNSLTYSQAAPDDSFSGGTPASTVTQVQEITIPETQTAPTGYNAVVSTFVAYTCVVTPTDDDSNASTPNRWWGKFRIAPSGWVLGTTSAESRLCRYTGDYVADGQVSNSEHPLWYRGVTGTLDHQNYVVIDGHRNCPTDSAVNTATGKYTNVNTTVHQTDVNGSGGALSGTNSGGADSNGGFTAAEPSYSTTVAIPMF
jgi:Tfp pilus assembly protein PilV